MLAWYDGVIKLDIVLLPFSITTSLEVVQVLETALLHG